MHLKKLNKLQIKCVCKLYLRKLFCNVVLSASYYSISPGLTVSFNLKVSIIASRCACSCNYKHNAVCIIVYVNKCKVPKIYISL